MGAWTVSETGLIYEMEYTNGFKRAIRKSQIAKSNTYQGIDYSSSQNPNLVLAKILASIQSFTTGTTPITFISDGSNGWDLSVIANPTTVQIPSGTAINSVHVEFYFWYGGSFDVIFDADLTVNDTINSGVKGAGMYEVLLTYNVSDGSTFQTFILVNTDATNNILGYYKYNGTVVNSVSGLNMSVSADVDTDTSIINEWVSFDGTTPTVIGTGTPASVTLLTNAIALGVFLDLGTNFPDFPNQYYPAVFTVTIN